MYLFALGQHTTHWHHHTNEIVGGFEDIDGAFCRKEEASFNHILAGCQKAFQSGRYTFRHNPVLRVFVHEMQVMINQIKKETERKVGKDDDLKLCLQTFAR